MLTGSHSAETTNVAADKSVVLDFHGSLAFVPQPDGSEELRMRGTAGFTLFRGDVGPGDIATGRNCIFTGNVNPGVRR
jgi:hypothetical protein